MLRLFLSCPQQARALQSASSNAPIVRRAIHQQGSHHPWYRQLAHPIASRNRGRPWLMARRPRGGFSLEDLDESFGERQYVALSGYEEDIESMARNYVPDYDSEFDPERGESGSARKDAPKRPTMAIASDAPPKKPAPEIQKPPPQAPRVVETPRSNLSEPFARKERQESQPSWADDYSDIGNDDDDDGIPICPLSMFSSIAEANVEPLKKEAPPKPSWNTPPRPDQQQPRSQEGSLPKSIAPPRPSMEKKIEEKAKPVMTAKPSTSSNRASSTPGRWSPNISVEEFRAKYAFIDDGEDSSGGTETLSMPTRQSASRDRSEAAEKSSQLPQRQVPSELSSSPEQDEIFQSKLRLEKLEEEIYTMNGSKFNLKSYKQVAKALFGDPNQSTSKEVLEGVAGSNILAKLMLEYREVSQRLSKLEKRKTTRATRVRSVVGEATASVAPTTTSKDDDEEDVNNESPASASRLLLLDTSSFIFRAYYSMPPLHRSTDGTPVGAVLGFCNMLNNLLLNSMLNGVRPYLVLCKDAGGPTFRNELYEGYKANRAEAPMDLIPQFDLIYEAAQAYGLVQISAPGYEADDIIATLCKQATEQNMGVDILSGDKDLMQLITNSTTEGGSVTMIDPMTMNRMTHDTVLEKWGVPAHMLGDLLALAGDTADNIPGVPGIGPKIAAQMLEEFGSLENLLENSNQIAQAKRREKLQEHADMARLSKDLVTLVPNVPADRMICIPEQAASLNIEDFRMEPMDADRILEFYDSMRFFTIKQRLLKRLEEQKRIAYQKSQHPQVEKKKTFSKKKVEPPKPEDYQDVPF